MRKFFDSLNLYYRIFFRAVLFAVSVFVIVLIFPREGKFKYEFQKGKPWMHETLIAPFDFPIYKTDKQIQAEKDSLLKLFSPYFVFDSSKVELETERFKNFFQKKTDEFIGARLENLNNKQKRLFINNANAFKVFSIKLLNNVYNKGVVDLSEIGENIESIDQITLLVEKVADNYSINSFFTQKTAYEYAINAVEKYLKDNKVNIQYPEFYKSVNLYEFIVPNIFYDKKTSENVKGTLLKNLSNSRGKIQEGEKIISKGELVDTYTHRVLESLKHDVESKMGSSYKFRIILIGQIIFVIACFTVLFLFLYNFRRDILQNSLKTLFILMLVLIIVSIASITLRISTNSIYIVPFALVPIIIKTFYDSRLALFIHIITVLLVGFFAPNGFEFVFLNFIAGIVAIFSLTNLYRRGKLFLSAALVICTYSFVYFGMAITQEGNLENIEWQNFMFFAFNGALVLSSYPLIYVFEKIFGFLSDVTLMELSDTNQKLLRELAEKAPGTFQHSIQVANLAEEAIIKVGGNPLLVRTGALYHDIGKLSDPIYFIENQRSGFNPHDMHEFDESADIIINHVKEGVDLARKYKLPEKIVDFIRTHHGTGKVQYFYRSYIKKFPNKDVDISKFSYPGPKPNSKETAVLMMADSVEAAARSLSDFNDESIDGLVEKIITNQINDGQFDNSDITFKDIVAIKAIFKTKIGNIYHTRIKYPEKN